MHHRDATILIHPHELIAKRRREWEAAQRSCLALHQQGRSLARSRGVWPSVSRHRTRIVALRVQQSLDLPNPFRTRGARDGRGRPALIAAPGTFPRLVRLDSQAKDDGQARLVARPRTRIDSVNARSRRGVSEWHHIGGFARSSSIAANGTKQTFGAARKRRAVRTFSAIRAVRGSSSLRPHEKVDRTGRTTAVRLLAGRAYRLLHFLCLPRRHM
jgi:hypothetical protein